MVQMEGPEPVGFRVKQFFRFQKEEVKHLLISIAVVTFLFAYNDGREVFNPLYWFSNAMLIFLIVTAAFIVHVSAQKIFALQVGYVSEYRMWTTGLIIGVIVTLLSGGKWYIILPGGIFIQHMAIQRLGKFRYGLNVKSMGNVAASGSVANLILATIAIMLGQQLHIFPPFFELVAKINFYILIFMLLPLPRLPGLYLFFASRLTYIFVFTTLAAYVLLVSFKIYSWVFAFLIGVLCWFLFYMYVEST